MTRARGDKRAWQAVWFVPVAPTPPDIPGRVVELSRAFWMYRPRRGHHMTDVVALGESRAEKDPSHVDVVGNVAPLKRGERYPEVTLEDLDGHRRLLLSDAREGLEASPQLSCRGLVVPKPRSITTVAVDDARAGGRHPLGDIVHEAVELRWRCECLAYCLTLLADATGMEMTEALAQSERHGPSPLGDDALVADHGQEESEGVGMDEVIRLVVGREACRATAKVCRETSAVGKERRGNRLALDRWRRW